MENIQNTNYKKTEIGLIPEDWEVVRLGDIAEIQQGKTPRRDLYDDKEGYRIIKVKDFENEKFVKHYPNGERSFVKVDLGDRYTLNQGDILILSAGHSSKVVGQKIGFYNLNPNNKVFFVSELLRIRANNKTNPLFLFFSIISQKSKKQIKEEVKGGHLYPRDLVNIETPLPPLPEQKAIATVLDKVRQAIEQTEEVIQANKELKKSLMKHLFTYGVVPPEETDKVKLKETEIGFIPEDWEVIKFGDVFEIQQGKALSSKNNQIGKPLPFLRTSNILWGKIKFDTLDKMYFTEKEQTKLMLKKGDLLICEGGEIGKTAIWKDHKEKIFFQNHIFRARPIKKYVHSLFYMYWIQYAIKQKKMYIGYGNKTTIPNLSKRRLSSFLIPLPPIDEQKQIAEILSKIDQKIEAEENKKEALEKLFKSLLNNLMTGKIRINKNFTGKFERKEIHQKMEELSKKLSEDKEYLEEIKEF